MTKQTVSKSGFIIYSLVMISGIFFVFIPQDFMVAIGEYCQLPKFVVTPVFEYMARGLSYAAFLIGLLLMYFAFHLNEQARLIRFVGWVALASIPVAIFIHIVSQTPLWWSVGDTSGLIILCILCFLTPGKVVP